MSGWRRGSLWWGLANDEFVPVGVGQFDRVDMVLNDRCTERDEPIALGVDVVGGEVEALPVPFRLGGHWWASPRTFVPPLADCTAISSLLSQTSGHATRCSRTERPNADAPIPIARISEAWNDPSSLQRPPQNAPSFNGTETNDPVEFEQML